MLVTMSVFAIGLICGLALSRVHLRLQQKKIRFYESYIHQRLRESLPQLGKYADPR